eukprot:TRINITY_DN23668_c0_g1_i1.p1 TRINITY_DN23668_c0_g1~~TRINITY_DN23668_c0_g1_i1.p1  ORF type:complete len:145 (-),score=20.07 TRINITY_DN23668_c0_g1_i1:128-562(-)
MGSSKKLIEPVFKNILNSIETFKKDFQIRRVSYGLISILECNPDNVPEVVRSGFGQIFKTLVGLCTKLVKINEEGSEESDSENNNSDSDSDSDYNPYNDDPNPIDGDEEFYYNPLDSVHELFYIRSRLQLLSQNNPSYLSLIHI